MGVPTVPPERRFAGLGTTFVTLTERFSTMLKYIVLATALLVHSFVLGGCTTKENPKEPQMQLAEEVVRHFKKKEGEVLAAAVQIARPVLGEQYSPSHTRDLLGDLDEILDRLPEGTKEFREAENLYGVVRIQSWLITNLRCDYRTLSPEQLTEYRDLFRVVMAPGFSFPKGGICPEKTTAPCQGWQHKKYPANGCDRW